MEAIVGMIRHVNVMLRIKVSVGFKFQNRLNSNIPSIIKHYSSYNTSG